MEIIGVHQKIAIMDIPQISLMGTGLTGLNIVGNTLGRFGLIDLI